MIIYVSFSCEKIAFSQTPKPLGKVGHSIKVTAEGVGEKVLFISFHLHTYSGLDADLFGTKGRC